jgi:hypothetical protein
MEIGSNVNIFHNDITFDNPQKESAYYYAIPKDFEWSFVALHATIMTSSGGEDLFHLTH